jgi:retinol dehydrogenase-12
MSLSFLLSILKSQYFVSLPIPTKSFEGQTVIVTGANTGLGFEAAKHITQLGAAKVIIACRSVEKGEAAKKKIEEATKAKGTVEVWQLDLSSYDSVKEFAAKASKLDRLDVLLENAGISTTTFALAEENESTITVNVVSTFLLALLLLPTLKETARNYNKQPHLVIVSSEVHFLSDLPEREDPSGNIFDTLSDGSKAGMSSRYPLSKLLEVLTVRALVAESAKSNYPVIINYVNPGFCHSELMREMGWIQYILKFVMNARTTEAGSRTLVAASYAGPESHGEYQSDCKSVPPSPFVMSEDGKKAGERVWTELKAKLESIQPGILKNI